MNFLKFLQYLVITLILPASYVVNTEKIVVNLTVPLGTKPVNPYAVSSKMVNPHEFIYNLNPEFQICGNNDDKYQVFLLIYVHTTPKNLKRRLTIRETWARRSMFRDIRIVFMMGSTDEKKTQNLIDLEANTYNDIVQENFHDSYRNLTYKGIMAMKWISTYCNKTEYILKVDDDIITNTFLVLRHLNSLNKYKIYKEKSIMCLVWSKMGVQRDKKSKWYLSKEEFEPDHFSPYCSGSAYILTGDLPKMMYEKSKYLKFLWIDDFYLTGLLIDAVNATHRSFNSMYIVNSGLVESTFSGKKADHIVFGHIPNANNKMYKLWKLILEREVGKYPSLRSFDSSLLQKKDFSLVEDFKWSYDIWKPFLEDDLKIILKNKTFFDYETF